MYLTEFGWLDRALELAREAVELEQARLTGDASTLALALDHYSYTAISLERFDVAETALTEAEVPTDLSTRRRHSLLETRAVLAARRGDLETAARVYEHIRNKHHSLGNIRDSQYYEIHLARVEHDRGQTARAIARVRDVLPAIRAGTDSRLLVYGLMAMTSFLITIDDFCDAEASAREVIKTLGRLEPNHAYVALAIEDLALIDAMNGQLERAATLEGYAEAAAEHACVQRNPTERTIHERINALLDDQLCDGDRLRFASAGTALTPYEAISLAVSFTEPWTEP